MDKYETFDAVRHIAGLCNSYNYGEQVKEFHDALTRQHRTLQQSFWRMIYGVSKLYVDAPYDLRNEDAVNFCRKLQEALPDEYFSTI